MKKFNLNQDGFIRGWIVGNFDPALIKSDSHEIGIKYYKIGDYEKSHRHNLSREVTVIVFGTVKINGIIYGEGDIIIQECGDYADFEVLSEKAITVVYRPDGSYPSDKEFL